MPQGPVQFRLSLRDNADTDVAVRWVDAAGDPVALDASTAAQVRAEPDSPDPPLLEADVVLLGAPDHWAQATFTSADIIAATMIDAAWWDFRAVRAGDLKPKVLLEGRVDWQPGVTR